MTWDVEPILEGPAVDSEQEEISMSKPEQLRVSRYSLPVFTEHDVDTKVAGLKVPPGTVVTVLERWEDSSDGWAKIEWEGATVWFVFTSNGQTYALDYVEGEGAGVSPDDEDAAWRAELRREQAGESWVAPMISEATSLIDSRAAGVARAAAVNMVSIIGIQERPASSNRGPALSGLVGEYVEHYRIASDKLSYGLAWCALSAQWAQAEAMGLEWATPASWSAHPLGNWIGAVWMQEKTAKAKGLWTVCSSLTGDEVLTGALLIQIRSGSGSDSASGGVAADGSYQGHVDIILGWKDNDTVWCVGGNISNTAKLVERNIRQSRCRGVVPFQG